MSNYYCTTPSDRKNL